MSDKDQSGFSCEFRLLTGHDPYPWQQALYHKLVSGTVSAALDIPTGLGKTAVMALWLIARASNHELPRRLVYVVDRRAVVDQATAEAEGLADRLCPDADGALGALRGRLGLEAEATLPVSTLRGQFADNRAWLADPASPAIVVGTIDMIGSRLLFGGYRISRWARPVHAGLIGCDTLLVIDEAHLVPPFAHLARAAADRDGVRQGRQAGPPALHLMTLTATAGGEAPGDGAALGLTDDDLKNARVQALLTAPKPLAFTNEAEPKTLAGKMADEAWALRPSGDDRVHRRILVYCNRRTDAEKVADALRKKDIALKDHVRLLTGARRVKERENLKEDPIYKWFLSGETDGVSAHAFLIATSAGEVGVDLDADAMVCDLVAWERMVQRLGRVNRRGGEAPAPVKVVPEGPEPLKSNAKKAAKEKRQARLDELRRYTEAVKCLPEDNGTYDASVGAITALKNNPDKAAVLMDATTPEPLRPALTRPLVDAWAMTSLDDHPGRPDDLTPWLRGWVDDDEPRCEIVWRRRLPWRRSDDRPDAREVARFFEAAPVHLTEILETPIGSAGSGVAQWLADRAKPPGNDDPDGIGDAGEQGAWQSRCVLLFDRRGRFVRAAGEKALRDKDRRKKFTDAIQTGFRLVVQADLGGLSTDGLLDAKAGGPTKTADGEDAAWAKQVGWRVVPDNNESGCSKEWRPILSLPGARTESEDPPPGLRIEKFVGGALGEDRDAPEVTGRKQSLADHSSWTECEARKLAVRLGFDEAMTDIFRTAGWLHDAGKDRDNWQAFIRNGNKAEPLAKNTARADPSLLRIAGESYRHEFGSLLDALLGAGPGRTRTLADEAKNRLKALPEGSRDLALHLVASHHGRARPVIAAVDQDHDLETCEAEARAAALRFALLQKQWGPWGLAWLEAVFRAADAAASARLDRDGLDDEGRGDG